MLPLANPSQEPLSAPAAHPEIAVRHFLVAVAIIWFLEIAVGFLLRFGCDYYARPDLISDPLLLVGVTTFSTGVLFVTSWFVVCRTRGLSLAEGFLIRWVGLRMALLSILLGLLAGGLFGFAAQYLTFEDSLMADLNSTSTGFLALGFMGILFPPFEEMYYRGLVFPVLHRKFGPVLAIVIATLWFGLAHYLQLGNNWVHLSMIVLMGFIWTLLRHFTGSLLPSILCHLSYNTCLVLPGLLEVVLAGIGEGARR